MTIAEARTSCKRRLMALRGLPRDILLVGILLATASLAFGLGLLEGRGEGSPAPMATSQPAGTPDSAPTAGQVVASKNGSKYYLSTCSAALRISAANRVTFPSAELAQAAGYTPAANCPGL